MVKVYSTDDPTGPIVNGTYTTMAVEKVDNVKNVNDATVDDNNWGNLGTVTASSFVGPLTGNADTATSVTTTVPVSKGGTNATSFTDKSVIITQDTGTDTLEGVAMGTAGQLLIGGASGPAVALLTAGANIVITNTDNAIEIAATGGGGRRRLIHGRCWIKFVWNRIFCTCGPNDHHILARDQYQDRRR